MAPIPGVVAGGVGLQVADPAGVVLQVTDWEFVLANADYLLGGTVLTIVLTITSLVLGFLVGLPAGAIEAYGGRESAGFFALLGEVLSDPGTASLLALLGEVLRRFVSFAGVILRGTPILVILMFTFFVLPVSDWIAAVLPVGSAFVAGVLGLGLRSGAYQSQVFRGAILSVDEGQMEAARSIGMSQVQAVRHVVVPQALRRSIPSFQNEFTIVLKDTSIVFAIGLSELITRSYDLFVQQTTAVLEVILFASAIYFVLTFTTNRGLDLVYGFYAIPGGESS